MVVDEVHLLKFLQHYFPFSTCHVAERTYIRLSRYFLFVSRCLAWLLGDKTYLCNQRTLCFLDLVQLRYDTISGWSVVLQSSLLRETGERRKERRESISSLRLFVFCLFYIFLPNGMKWKRESPLDFTSFDSNRLSPCLFIFSVRYISLTEKKIAKACFFHNSRLLSDVVNVFLSRPREVKPTWIIRSWLYSGTFLHSVLW